MADAGKLERSPISALPSCAVNRPQQQGGSSNRDTTGFARSCVGRGRRGVVVAHGFAWGAEVRAGVRALSPHPELMTRSHLPGGEPPEDTPPRPPEREPDTDPPMKEPPETNPPVKEPPVKDPASDDAATLAGVERFLLVVFLRRKVTCLAGRRRLATMNGAAELHADRRH